MASVLGGVRTDLQVVVHGERRRVRDLVVAQEQLFQARKSSDPIQALNTTVHKQEHTDGRTSRSEPAEREAWVGVG